jgi:hypothetical protein
MSAVTEIREAIRKLPPREAWKLAEELREHLDALWDKQFEEDVKAGRLDAVITRAREEHTAGKTRPMAHLFRKLYLRRKQRIQAVRSLRPNKFAA